MSDRGKEGKTVSELVDLFYAAVDADKSGEQVSHLPCQFSAKSLCHFSFLRMNNRSGCPSD